MPTRSILDVQSDILEAIALGKDLKHIAEMICRQVENLTEGVVCSLITVDQEGWLHPLAAPSLPARYGEYIETVQIGPKAGSCGTAAFRGEEVVVVEIETDPLWETYRALVRPLGLKASWSTPIRAEDGRVMACFAFYFRSCRGPTSDERRIVTACVNLCLVAFRYRDAGAHIQRLAYTDILTNLPNRVSFELFACDALANAGTQPIAIHHLDLDDFKTINDSLGHWVGDLLLAEVGRRLGSFGGEGICVARLGGDEFAICGPAGEDLAMAERILAAFAPAFEVAGHRLKVDASIGTAIAPQHGGELEQLFRHADIALYEAKNAGRHTSRIFSPDMAEMLNRRNLMKAHLASGLALGQFHLDYQPIVDFETGAIASFEALLRWTHPERGRIPPDLFIPIAEEMGLIQEIGLFVLRQALQDASAWPCDIAVAVNVSPLQLKSPRFALDVATAVGQAGLPAQRLTVEVTETALLDDDAVTRHNLDGLVALGLELALDDFGTGYSSLGHLRDRRFSRIKIDKSFVAGLGQDADCEAIVEGTIHFAKKLGKSTTAEGIETPLQMAWLEAQGCDTGQGYLFSRPMRAGDIPLYLSAHAGIIAGATAGMPGASGPAAIRRVKKAGRV